MFEILKWIAELVTKLFSVPQFVEMRKKEKLAEIGIDLFLMYDSLTRLIADGHGIVRAMIVAIADYEAGVSQEKSREDLLHLRNLVFPQDSSLARFSRDLMNFRPHINAIDPESARRLSYLIDEKYETVRYLGYEIFHLKKETIFSLHNIVTAAAQEDIHAIEVHATDERLDLEEARFVVTPRIYRALREHIRIGKPEEALAALSVASDKLREAIIAVFSLEEILLRVGERIKRQEAMTDKWKA